LLWGLQRFLLTHLTVGFIYRLDFAVKLYWVDVGSGRCFEVCRDVGYLLWLGVFGLAEAAAMSSMFGFLVDLAGWEQQTIKQTDLGGVMVAMVAMVAVLAMMAAVVVVAVVTMVTVGVSVLLLDHSQVVV